MPKVTISSQSRMTEWGRITVGSDSRIRAGFLVTLQSRVRIFAPSLATRGSEARVVGLINVTLPSSGRVIANLQAVVSSRSRLLTGISQAVSSTARLFDYPAEQSDGNIGIRSLGAFSLGNRESVSRAMLTAAASSARLWDHITAHIVSAAKIIPFETTSGRARIWARTGTVLRSNCRICTSLTLQTSSRAFIYDTQPVVAGWRVFPLVVLDGKASSE